MILPGLDSKYLYAALFLCRISKYDSSRTIAFIANIIDSPVLRELICKFKNDVIFLSDLFPMLWLLIVKDHPLSIHTIPFLASFFFFGDRLIFFALSQIDSEY